MRIWRLFPDATVSNITLFAALQTSEHLVFGYRMMHLNTIMAHSGNKHGPLMMVFWDYGNYLVAETFPDKTIQKKHPDGVGVVQDALKNRHRPCGRSARMVREDQRGRSAYPTPRSAKTTGTGNRTVSNWKWRNWE